MGGVYKRGKYWHLWYKDEFGNRVYKGAKCKWTTKTTAESNLAICESEVPYVRHARKKKAKSKSVVYFIQSATGGPIKIGITDNLKFRLKQLQSCCPFQLIVKAVSPDDGEKSLHDEFAKHRLHGEWFEENESLIELMFQLNTHFNVCDFIKGY